MFAAGLFENPWLVAIIVLVGALANWLSKRRQEKQTGHQPEESEPPPATDQPKGEFNLEEAMRRLLGEPSSPQPSGLPPIIPRTSTTGPSFEADWQDAEELQPEQPWMDEIQEGRAEARDRTGQMPPLLRSTPVAPARAGITIIPPNEELAHAAPHLAQLSEPSGRPATSVHGVGRRLRPGARAAYWRNPRNARQAFVASVVIGPPKSLET